MKFEDVKISVKSSAFKFFKIAIKISVQGSVFFYFNF